MDNLIVWDLEADGLLEDSNNIHCISLFNILKDTKCTLYGDSLEPLTIKSYFERAKYIIGHNIISYDIPMIKKFYNIDLIELLGIEAIIDTFLWSRVSYPDRPMPKNCPTTIRNPVTNKSKKIGPHGLESWGWRMGEKKIEIHDWRYFTPEIIERCEIDVSINHKTYLYLCKEMGLNPNDPYQIQ